MFDIAWSELLIVAIVAIVVVGPKELPGLLRTFGRMVGKLRRHADEFRRQFDESMREAGGDELKRELDQLRYNNPLNEIRNTIENAAREVTDPQLTFDSPTTPASTAGTAATETTPPATPATGTPAVAPEMAPATPAPASAPAEAPQQDATANTNTPGQPHVNGQQRPL